MGILSYLVLKIFIYYNPLFHPPKETLIDNIWSNVDGMILLKFWTFEFYFIVILMK